jgi:hypothetical protein
MHLTLVGKQLQEELFKTAVQIPVYSSDIVSKHVFAIIRKLNGLTVGTHKVLSSEKSAEIGTQLKGESFQTTEKGIV